MKLQNLAVEKNIFDCPSNLWNQMTEKKRRKYNDYMDKLDFDEWCTLEGEIIKDRKILAHNAIINTIL